MIEEGISKIEELVKLSLGPQYDLVTLGETPCLVSPLGQKVEVTDLAQYQEFPRRKFAKVGFSSALSFMTYVNDHKEPGTHLFGDADKGTVLAEIDFHKRGDGADPQWRSHQATLSLPPSDDWKRWTQMAGQNMTQTDLAEFLEEMDHTIVEPDGASLIELVEKMKLTSDVRFESSVNRTSGGVAFLYKDELQTAGQIKVPDKVSICVAPFRHCDPVDMLVHLRYRLREGKLTFAFKLHRPDKVIDEAFSSLCEEIESSVGLPVLLV